MIINVKKILQASVTLMALLTLMFLSAIISLKVVTWGETVEVPNIVGKDLSDAVNLLGEDGLEIKVSNQEHHQSIPANAVIFQDPQPGRPVKKGRSVSVVVSLGSMEVTAPVLSGEPFKRAQILVSGEGLSLGEVARVYSDTPKNSVIAQYPPAGTVLQKGERVDILLSDGARPARLVMADLTGSTLSEAEEVTRPMAIRMIAGGKGSVIVSQNPEPGQEVVAGTALYVTLGPR